MIFTVVLIALFVQWFVNLDGRYRRYNWFQWLYGVLHKKANIENAWVNIVYSLIVPLVVLGIVDGVLTHFWGVVGEFIVSLVLVWYCVDYDGVKAAAKKSSDLEFLLMMSFERVFAMIFWFALLNIFGIALYYLVAVFRRSIEKHEKPNASLLKALIQLQGIMDWIPLRLVGITFALVGRFGSGFAAVAKGFFSGLKNTHQQAVDWAMASLEAGEDEFKAGLLMVDRGLLIWLVVLALISIGAWVG